MAIVVNDFDILQQFQSIKEPANNKFIDILYSFLLFINTIITL